MTPLSMQNMFQNYFDDAQASKEQLRGGKKQNKNGGSREG